MCILQSNQKWITRLCTMQPHLTYLVTWHKKFIHALYLSLKFSTSRVICFYIWLQYQDTDPCKETMKVFSCWNIVGNLISMESKAFQRHECEYQWNSCYCEISCPSIYKSPPLYMSIIIFKKTRSMT